GGRVTLEQVALIETLGMGYHAVERGALLPGEGAVVVGAGPIGLSVIQFATLAGARVMVVDTNPARRQFARTFGVEQAVDAGEDAAEAVAAWAGPDLAHVVFAATGRLEAMGARLRL